mmetsp:Transcript_7842/g.28665  ORF Transcript_7842/g.28665 Transcript_7842/m.28665 type:complete len:367 (+) Transcript_7842:1375-2475(+)
MAASALSYVSYLHFASPSGQGPGSQHCPPQGPPPRLPRAARTCSRPKARGCSSRKRSTILRHSSRLRQAPPSSVPGARGLQGQNRLKSWGGPTGHRAPLAGPCHAQGPDAPPLLGSKSAPPAARAAEGGQSGAGASRRYSLVPQVLLPALAMLCSSCCLALTASTTARKETSLAGHAAASTSQNAPWAEHAASQLSPAPPSSHSAPRTPSGRAAAAAAAAAAAPAAVRGPRRGRRRRRRHARSSAGAVCMWGRSNRGALSSAGFRAARSSPNIRRLRCPEGWQRPREACITKHMALALSISTSRPGASPTVAAAPAHRPLRSPGRGAGRSAWAVAWRQFHQLPPQPDKLAARPESRSSCPFWQPRT